MLQIIQNKYVILGYTTLILLLVLSTPSMSPVFTIPYLTADNSIFRTGEWTYCLENLRIAKSLNAWELYLFEPDFSCEEKVGYNLNNPLYVLIGFVSKEIFPFLGPLGAVVLFQLCTHGILCLIAVKYISAFERNKLLFYYLYASNPLVLLVVTMGFYYFWASLVSFTVIVIREKGLGNVWQQLLLLVCLGLGFFARQTSVALVLFCVIFVLIKYKVNSLIFVSLLITLFYLVKTTPFISSGDGNQVGSYLPVHQLFIGVGAYPNPFGIKSVSDNVGLDRYNQITNQNINTSPLESDWSYNLPLRENYDKVLLKEIKVMFIEHPFIYFRNAILNFLAGYSFGYTNAFPYWMKLIISSLGLVFACYLLYYRLYIDVLVIALSHVIFTPYFPPIPVYMFSTYILLIYSLQKSLHLVR